MKKIINYIKTHKVRSIIGLGVILSLLVVFISFSLADPTPNYTFTYNSTGTNNNYSNNDGGSFRLNKSIQWVSHNKLKVTMFIDSKEFINSTGNDVLLVVDTSSFLDNNMLTDLKSSLTSAASFIRTKDSNSRIGIIEFNNSYTKYDFTTNNTTISNNISNLSLGNGRSYYQAFLGIDDILTNRDTSRGLRVVFITTGLSSINKSGDIYKYEQIDNKYHLNMNCIYYLTNGKLTQPSNYFSREISSSRDELTVNVESLGIDYKSYTNFTVTDHYDSSKFSLVGNLSDYNGSSQYTNYGSLSVNSAGEIQWIMDDNDSRPFYTGTTAKLEYELNYTGGTGNYSLNTTGIVTSKTINQVLSNVTINDSLVVGNSYNVTYVANAPSGCSPSGSYGAIHKDVKEIVQFPSKPTCSGYKFVGWKITTSDVNKNDNGFVMPDANVEVKATWSKVTITKDMSGDVVEPKPLYNVIKSEAESNGLAREYTGTHQDTMAGSGSSKIYYYYDPDTTSTALLNKNNVIFANYCWQMIRTTDTGGVKMIYNGPVVNNKCSSVLTDTGETTNNTYINYGITTSTVNLTISGTVYFGTDYTYNASTQKFSLAGTKTATTWSSTDSSLVGKYTCNSTGANDTCSTLYLLTGNNGTTAAAVTNLTAVNTRYGNAGLGTNMYNSNCGGLSCIGYMSNKRSAMQAVHLGYGYKKVATSYSYNSSTQVYALAGTTAMRGDGDDFSGYRYMLLDSTGKTLLVGTCAKTRYFYAIGLTGGKTINAVISDSLTASDVNTYDSTIKLVMEKWYEHNILPYSNYTSKLENDIYCDDRRIVSMGSFDPSNTFCRSMTFTNSNTVTDLSCANNLDKLSVDNNSAKMKYPIGLLSAPEFNLLGGGAAWKTGQFYWLGSPSEFTSSHEPMIRAVDANGALSSKDARYSYDTRPVISLKPGTSFSGGNGSMDHPYIVN